ncbi:hypothetical protein JNUCC1_02388 [Lentibacillus sp. JNUCC-1]|nr:hypothetical protein [Lentibacillus sp. JNUCC-1]
MLFELKTYILRMVTRMPSTTFSSEEIQTFVNEIKKQLVPILVEELKESELPPLLTRKQFMDITGVGPTKCNELFNRGDFPVTRELGHPKVPTKMFFDWLYASAQNVQEVRMKYPYSAI